MPKNTKWSSSWSQFDRDDDSWRNRSWQTAKASAKELLGPDVNTRFEPYESYGNSRQYVRRTGRTPRLAEYEQAYMDEYATPWPTDDIEERMTNYPIGGQHVYPDDWQAPAKPAKSNTGSTSTAKSKGKGKAKADPDGPTSEKRLARYRKSCPKNITERVERVYGQRFFLIDRNRNGQDLQETFKVLGSTGNVYTIVIDQMPRCDCPDAEKGNHCKHILFVMLKVLQVPQTSENYYQKALLTSELEEVFARAPPAPRAEILNTDLSRAFSTATGKPIKEEPVAASTSTGKRKLPGPDDTCPICYEETEGEPESAFVFCETSCGQAVHKECFKNWATAKGPNDLTCVWCREPWPGANQTPAALGNPNAAPEYEEGYLNLAANAGVSRHRDTTSYYHGPVRGKSQAQAYADAVRRYGGNANDLGWEFGY